LLLPGLPEQLDLAKARATLGLLAEHLPDHTAAVVVVDGDARASSRARSPGQGESERSCRNPDRNEDPPAAHLLPCFCCPPGAKSRSRGYDPRPQSVSCPSNTRPTQK